MNGLMQQQMAPQQEQMPEQAPQEGRHVGPYKSIIEMAKQVIYSEEGVNILKQALSAGDPAGAIAQMVAQIVQQVIQPIKEAGKDVPERMITAAMIEIVAMVSELAYKGGYLPEGQEQEIVKEAAGGAMAMLGEMNQDMPSGKRQQFAQIAEGVFGGGEA